MKRFSLLLVFVCGVAYGQWGLPSTGGFGDSPGSFGTSGSPSGTSSVLQYDPAIRTKSVWNSGSRYGSVYGGWPNPYSVNCPRIYDGGEYRGRLSVNPYGRDSVFNPYSPYGSRYGTDSVWGRRPSSPYVFRSTEVYPGR